MGKRGKQRERINEGAIKDRICPEKRQAPGCTPRLNNDQNKPYNSCKHFITKTTDMSRTIVTVEPEKEEFILREIQNLHKAPGDSAGNILVKISAALSIPIQISSAGAFYMVCGTTNTGQRVIALSPSHASVLYVNKDWLYEHNVPSDHESSLLFSMLGNFMVTHLDAVMPLSGTLVVHEPE
jgi:hypothetical protein